jgi:glc operon protein GlcG
MRIGLVIGAMVALATATATAADKRVLTLSEAKAVAAAAVAEAGRLKAPGGALAVVDDGGHLLYLERLDGTFPSAASVATGKARTAAIFRKPTLDFENAANGGRTALVGVSEMVPLQGGVPIVVGGQVVGAIGVSGAASAQQDEEIARAGAAAFK